MRLIYSDFTYSQLSLFTNMLKNDVGAVCRKRQPMRENPHDMAGDRVTNSLQAAKSYVR